MFAVFLCIKGRHADVILFEFSNVLMPHIVWANVDVEQAGTTMISTSLTFCWRFAVGSAMHQQISSFTTQPTQEATEICSYMTLLQLLLEARNG